MVSKKIARVFTSIASKANRSQAKSSVGAAARPTGAPKKAAGGPVVKAAQPAKPKLVRDSFTIPKAEYIVLHGLKDRATQLRRPTKKSELLRAGIAALHRMPDKTFLAALVAVPSLKTGRPKRVSKT